MEDSKGKTLLDGSRLALAGTLTPGVQACRGSCVPQDYKTNPGDVIVVTPREFN